MLNKLTKRVNFEYSKKYLQNSTTNSKFSTNDSENCRSDLKLAFFLQNNYVQAESLKKRKTVNTIILFDDFVFYCVTNTSHIFNTGSNTTSNQRPILLLSGLISC